MVIIYRQVDVDSASRELMNTAKPLSTRTTGILLHPTSLPGNPICGSFGDSARIWIEKLSKHDIGVWQVLPLSPTDSTGSPYSSPSSFAINPWFIDVNDLIKDNFLPSSILNDLPGENHNSQTNRLDFNIAQRRSDYIGKHLRVEWIKQSPKTHQKFKEWCKRNKWIDQHSTFMEIRKQHNYLPWWQWPQRLRENNSNEIKKWKKINNKFLLEHKLLQWHLNNQWQNIKKKANESGILIFGDLPFYVSKDSVDVWSNRSLFSIDSKGEMELQSGVPPDYFSETGQLWGTPVYKWWCHRLNNFKWWRQRLRRQWELFDLLRLDHFRALVSYWAIPGKDVTAERGQWKDSPGVSLLKLLKKDCSGNLPLVAEDLGIITNEVESLRDQFNLPGMKVLQFAFNGDSENPYLPENIKGNRWVVYTGTHDNSTTMGWWEQLDINSKRRFEKYFNGKIESPGWQLLELGLSSEAGLVITPIQDLLHLNDASRFNKPGTVGNNWTWRLSKFNHLIDGALKGYGERGAVWGRSGKSAVDLLKDFGSL